MQIQIVCAISRQKLPHLSLGVMEMETEMKLRGKCPSKHKHKSQKNKPSTSNELRVRLCSLTPFERSWQTIKEPKRQSNRKQLPKCSANSEVLTLAPNEQVRVPSASLSSSSGTRGVHKRLLKKFCSALLSAKGSKIIRGGHRPETNKTEKHEPPKSGKRLNTAQVLTKDLVLLSKEGVTVQLCAKAISQGETFFF